MSRTNVPTLHFNISVTLNESNWSYDQPRTDHNISFSVPAEMFSEKSFAELVNKRISAMQKQFALEKVAFEEEQNQKELQAVE